MVLVSPLSLFASGRPDLDSSVRFRRHQLDPCCWVDTVDRFLTGADRLLVELEAGFDWQQGRRLMYGRWVDEPRLTARLELADEPVPEVVARAADELGRHYGRRFDGLFCNYYRNGDDSVAWHADRIGRTTVDPLVAIISLGGPRVFAMRDQAGGRSVRWTMHSGDLLVMGGATQHHWEHAIPKTRHAPPRMSLTTRAGWRPGRLRLDQE